MASSERICSSLSLMVPVAVLMDASSAFVDGLLSTSWKLSSSSSSESSVVAMLTVFSVSPAAKVMVWAEAGV